MLIKNNSLQVFATIKKNHVESYNGITLEKKKIIVIIVVETGSIILSILR